MEWSSTRRSHTKFCSGTGEEDCTVDYIILFFTYVFIFQIQPCQIFLIKHFKIYYFNSYYRLPIMHNIKIFFDSLTWYSLISHFIKNIKTIMALKNNILLKKLFQNKWHRTCPSRWPKKGRLSACTFKKMCILYLHLRDCH